MKKLSISGQIAILFTFILIISAVSFTSITLIRLKDVAEQETYSRLITYSALLNAHTQDPNVDFDDMKVGFVKVRGGLVMASTDITSYLSPKELEKIIEEAIAVQKDTSIVKRKIINLDHKTIYYVVTFTEGIQGFNLIVTNSLFVHNL